MSTYIQHTKFYIIYNPHLERDVVYYSNNTPKENRFEKKKKTRIYKRKHI
jgi:hypothetical protein